MNLLKKIFPRKKKSPAEEQKKYNARIRAMVFRKNTSVKRIGTFTQIKTKVKNFYSYTFIYS